jgi:hypothetical protein
MKRAPRTCRAAAPALAVALALLAACGDDDATTTSAASSTVASSVPSTPTAGSEPTTEPSSSEATTGSTDTEATTPPEGSASGSKSDYVAALADNVQVDDRDMAECIAGALVDAVGFDGIQESGMSPEEFARGDQLEERGLSLEASQAPDLARAFVACGDIAEAYISTESAPDAQKECERGVLTNQLTAEFLATQLTGAPQSEELKAAAQQATACRQSSTPTTTG